MPNSENLRKQAKLYVRWHRQRYYPVAAVIRGFLPRFLGLTDQGVLDAVFKLGDAQELVARKHGYAGWAELMEGIKTMSAAQEKIRRTTAIIAAEPQIFVSDLSRAVQFYVHKLGFELAFSHGEPAFYAQVFRDGGRINLRQVDVPVFDSSFHEREHDALCVTFTLDDAKPLYLEFEAASVPFHQSLRNEPWGARTFIVRDPDGNLIGFSGAGQPQD